MLFVNLDVYNCEHIRIYSPIHARFCTELCKERLSAVITDKVYSIKPSDSLFSVQLIRDNLGKSEPHAIHTPILPIKFLTAIHTFTSNQTPAQYTHLHSHSLSRTLDTPTHAHGRQSLRVRRDVWKPPLGPVIVPAARARRNGGLCAWQYEPARLPAWRYGPSRGDQGGLRRRDAGRDVSL